MASSDGSARPASGRPRAAGRALYGGLPEPGPPGFAPRLLEFADELRGEGLAVGTSELLDAFQVLGELSWAWEEDFREALAATLAKSQEDRRVFELVFERFFFRASEIAAARHGIHEQDAAGLEELSDDQLDALRAQIAAALRDGADGAMRDLARMAIAAFARRQEGSGVIGVDVQRMRRAMRASLQTGGVPVVLKFRPRRPRRPEIYVLCDVSTSVTSASVFFLSVLHALHDTFRKMRSFVFIERISEVTDIFEHERNF